jgi:hypothetical protein
MHLDMQTMSAVNVTVTAVLGGVLLFTWARERDSAFVDWWGLALVIMSVGVMTESAARGRRNLGAHLRSRSFQGDQRPLRPRLGRSRAQVVCQYGIDASHVVLQLGLARDIAMAMAGDIADGRYGRVDAASHAARVKRIEGKADAIALEARRSIERTQANPTMTKLVNAG